MSESEFVHLAAALRGRGIEIGPPALAALARYRALLLAWNQKMNLTAITEPKEVEIKHFLDSLLLLALSDRAIGGRVADAGSGPGLPGLPLKILLPSLRLDLLEAAGKKVRFLEAVIGDLGLTDTRALPLRAEDAGRGPELRESYDWVVSRAMAPLPVALELCLPLARVGGWLALYKGPDGPAAAEAAARVAGILGGRLTEILAGDLPEGSGARTILLYQKVGPTPAGFPRRSGLPAKRPLV
ncbi:MAG: 16S rRNA (guanine(527)-N(7))-methyltransferase RsmG [Peptococcaceae bacterium]|jgi:16S rRNA (guanine527-N7)-methyltransferase|nr:16S rRNA (guanine(527)-N(7))-methyltransferase RsmG [Peptococcaceae bacterium]